MFSFQLTTSLRTIAFSKRTFQLSQMTIFANALRSTLESRRRQFIVRYDYEAVIHDCKLKTLSYYYLVERSSNAISTVNSRN